jgi:hypothetical protein
MRRRPLYVKRVGRQIPSLPRDEVEIPRYPHEPVEMKVNFPAMQDYYIMHR